MFVTITHENIVHEGGVKYFLTNNTYIIVFKSPNHPQVDYELRLKGLNSIHQITDIFKNDSFIFVDEKTSRVTVVRDWPGNVQIFYYYNKKNKILLISDNISELAKKIPNTSVSHVGVNLFLNNRKHYHTHTIYNNIEFLPGGLFIDISFVNKPFFSINYWYRPFRKTEVKNKSIASKQYLEALDNVLSKLIVKSNPIALMFSGGSDSVLLLDRLIKFGYTDIHLFTICVEGHKTQIDYANEKAEIYGLKVNPISVSAGDVLSGWKELYEYCYHYLSDLRIDGIFSPSVHVFKYLNSYFQRKPATIVWGSQYALISPMMNSRGILKFYLSYLIKKLSSIIPLSNKCIYSFILYRGFRKAPIFLEGHVAKGTLEAYKNLYIECISNLKTPEQLLDLYLSTNYNSCKHWWMDWRGKVKDIYYPNAINVYPFHDRWFQEKSMPISLKIRLGGLKNMFRMPDEYKNFFYSLIPKNIPIDLVKRGNYKALPEFFSLYKNEKFFDDLTSTLKNSEYKELVDRIIIDNNIVIPESYDSFLKLDYLEVEKLSGILFLIIRLKTDNIEV